MTDENTIQDPRLEEIAKAAAEINTTSGEEAFESIVEGINKVPEQLQAMIDSVVAIQFDWPMPEEGWRRFVEDVERTNERLGLNLRIDLPKPPGPLNIVDALDKYAKSLDKTRDELDENEKMQAMMNAVIEIAMEKRSATMGKTKCPDCDVALEFGSIKDLRGAVFECIWFCPQCLWPFYGKEYMALLQNTDDDQYHGCPSLESDVKNFDYVGWISVEERMPEVGQKILGWAFEKTVEDKIGFPLIISYESKGLTYEFVTMREDECYAPVHITHWMPLPEPPST